MGGRTQQEQIDALLDEISAEVEIDTRAADTGPAANITDRLNQLKSNLNTTDKSGLLRTNCSKNCIRQLTDYSFRDLQSFKNQFESVNSDSI